MAITLAHRSNPSIGSLNVIASTLAQQVLKTDTKDSVLAANAKLLSMLSIGNDSTDGKGDNDTAPLPDRFTDHPG